MKLKYKVMLALIVVAMGICFMTLQSYALWIARYESGENIAEVGCYSIDFAENQGPISLNNTYPMSDTKALNGGVYYSFTVRNTCTTDSKYAVTINPLKSNTLTKDKIKYAIYKSTETKPTSGINLGTVTDVNTDLSAFSNASSIDESLIVATGFLKGATINGGNDGESVTYILYLWMDENDTIADKNKTFEASVYVSNVAKKKNPTAAETILGLVPDADPTSTAVIDNGTDESGCTKTLAYDDFGNLRYVGKNPCNYVTFNGEEAGWRIIGVFDNQIKLIRNEFIGEYSWDTSATSVNGGYGINQWGESGEYTGADLMKLLNPWYETNLAEDDSGNTISGTYVNNSLYWNRSSGNCYKFGKNGYTTCDFSTTGLTEAAKDMIDNHTWNLGSQGSNDVNTRGNGLGLAKKFYEYERSNNIGKICTSGNYCNDTVERTTTWEGYVGLMYPSDYGYAVGGEARESCLANTNLHDYYKCYKNDWLFKYSSTYQWTLSPDVLSSNAYRVFGVGSDGNVYDGRASLDDGVRPALFLIPSITISEGNGSSTNPYVFSLE
ncbi:MAG: hypothetical protein IJ704_05785 [Bacilli bacterium]|nr:hypothetical protein [Bacilli bacterium]